jgi:hypothetical protein
MIGLLCFALAVLASPFKSKVRLEAENAVLRHQLIVLKRRLHGRVRLTNHDRWLFIQPYRWFPAILKVLTIIRPETLVRWHRAGFSLLLALEVAPTRRTTADRHGVARIDPADEHGESALGSARSLSLFNRSNSSTTITGCLER